jgi:hypothetical protein
VTVVKNKLERLLDFFQDGLKFRINAWSLRDIIVLNKVMPRLLPQTLGYLEKLSGSNTPAYFAPPSVTTKTSFYNIDTRSKCFYSYLKCFPEKKKTFLFEKSESAF